MKPLGGSGKPWNSKQSIPSKPPPPLQSQRAWTKPWSASCTLPRHHGNHKQDGTGSCWKTGLWLQQMSPHTGSRNDRLWSVCSVTLCGSDPQAARCIYYRGWSAVIGFLLQRGSSFLTRQITRGTSAGSRCHNIKFRKWTLHCITAYLMTTEGICNHTACLRILLLSRPYVMSTSSWNQSLQSWLGDDMGLFWTTVRGNVWELRFPAWEEMESRTAPWGRGQWPRRLQNMQRSLGFYWPEAKYDWHGGAVTLDSRAAKETRYLFACS